MNEEEIIKRLTKPKKYTLIEILRKFKRDGIENYIITKPELLQGLLDLYNKEKERNKELEKIEYIKRNFDYCLEKKTKELEKEIKYWREQAEGYQGLAEQIKEDFENRDRWE